MDLNKIYSLRQKFTIIAMTGRAGSGCTSIGHRPITVDVCKEKVYSNKNVINLDTGCVYSNMNGLGALTAFELNTRSLYFA
jgi:hypothetical protein